MKTYFVDFNYFSVEAESLEDARKQALEFIAEGNVTIKKVTED